MVVFTPIAFINLYCVYYNTTARHFWQLVLCAPSILGTYFCFIPEMMKGSPNLDWHTPMHKYFYFYFVNGLWVVIPLILCYHSFEEINRQSRIAQIYEMKQLEKKNT